MELGMASLQQSPSMTCKQWDKNEREHKPQWRICEPICEILKRRKDSEKERQKVRD